MSSQLGLTLFLEQVFLALSVDHPLSKNFFKREANLLNLKMSVIKLEPLKRL